MSSYKLEARWKACLFAILTVSIHLIAFIVTSYAHEHNGIVYTVKLVLWFGVPAYVSYSLIGWIFIGLPLHRLIERYTKSDIRHYLLVSLLLSTLILIFGSWGSFLLYGIPMVLQSVAFGYFIKRYATAKR